MTATRAISTARWPPQFIMKKQSPRIHPAPLKGLHYPVGKRSSKVARPSFHPLSELQNLLFHILRRKPCKFLSRSVQKVCVSSFLSPFNLSLCLLPLFYVLEVEVLGPFGLQDSTPMVFRIHRKAQRLVEQKLYLRCVDAYVLVVNGAEILEGKCQNSLG